MPVSRHLTPLRTTIGQMPIFRQQAAPLRRRAKKHKANISKAFSGRSAPTYLGISTATAGSTAASRIKRGKLMTAAPKFRIDVAINDLLTAPTQRQPAPAPPKGLTLPKPVFPQFPERLNDPVQQFRPRSGNGGFAISTVLHAAGCSRMCVRARCPESSTPSRRISLSSTSATWTAGTAGRMTTRSRA